MILQRDMLYSSSRLFLAFDLLLAPSLRSMFMFVSSGVLTLFTPERHRRGSFFATRRARCCLVVATARARHALGASRVQRSRALRRSARAYLCVSGRGGASERDGEWHQQKSGQTKRGSSRHAPRQGRRLGTCRKSCQDQVAFAEPL